MCTGITVMLLIGLVFLIPALMHKKEGFYLINPPPPEVRHTGCGEKTVVHTDMYGRIYRNVHYDSGASFPAAVHVMEDNF